MYSVKKILGGFPCAHRQHGHDGHCAYVHGYNIKFVIEFESEYLDENGFVVDFGKLKELRSWCEDMFDHTLLINEDDPLLEFFMELESHGACVLTVMDNVSMEYRALYVANEAIRMGLPVVKVTCWENDTNAGAVDVGEDHVSDVGEDHDASQ